MTSSAPYAGNELELFAQARNWKDYWSKYISKYVGRNVLDVGAGMGATAHLLARPSMDRWVALEPDADLARQIAGDVESGQLPTICDVRIGTTESLANDERFDTIIYADVLEHIENDREELERAARHLTPNGHIIVLAPAHQWLFTAFDEAVGHFRRYDRASLRRAGPVSLTLVKMNYLDSVGVLASSANRFLLRSDDPSLNQIKVWDRLMVPISRCIDPVLGRSVGKSIVGVWRKPGAS